MDREQEFTPAALLNKPVLAMDMMEIAKAYQVLHSTRFNSGFDISPITVGEIRNYVELVGVPWCGCEEFIDQIKRLDEYHMKEVREKG